MMNPRELDVISVLANSQQPMMASDIVKKRYQSLTQSTVTFVLRKLLEEEIVEVAGVTHSGKVLSRTYRLTPKAKSAVLEDCKELYSQIKSIVTVEEIVKAMSENSDN